MTSNPFSPAEQVALAGVIKDTALTKAKADLSDGFSGSVDFTVRITGAVQKGTRTQAGTYESVPIVQLDYRHIFAAIRELGIGRKRFANAIALVPLDAKPDEEFGSVLNAENESRAKLLPKVIGTSPGRAGTVNSQITAQRLTPD